MANRDFDRSLDDLRSGMSDEGRVKNEESRCKKWAVFANGRAAAFDGPGHHDRKQEGCEF